MNTTENKGLDEALQRLASFETSELPVVTLYVNAETNDRGRDHFAAFIRKELKARLKTFLAHSPEQESLQSDINRITEYLNNELEPGSNGAAIFACSGRDFFEALQFDVPIPDNQVFVQGTPNLFRLAWLNEHFKRYAVVLADTMSARIFLLGLGQIQQAIEIDNVHVAKTQVGGWSQARYQRRADGFAQKHAQEVADTLEKLVETENIGHILLIGDEIVIPVIQSRLHPKLSEKVRDVLRMDMTSSEREVLDRSLEAMRRADERRDSERILRLIDEYRSGGLAVVGLRGVLEALLNGQVNELIIAADPNSIDGVEDLDRDQLDAYGIEIPLAKEADRSKSTTPQMLADLLITKAEQTRAQISFIEQSEQLSNTGGVGAFLRYRI